MRFILNSATEKNENIMPKHLPILFFSGIIFCVSFLSLWNKMPVVRKLIPVKLLVECLAGSVRQYFKHRTCLALMLLQQLKYFIP